MGKVQIISGVGSGGGGGGDAVWGDITGTLSNQTDLQTELDEISTYAKDSTRLLLNTNPAIYADGDSGEVDSGGAAGWYYRNAGTTSKINWYFYRGNSINHPVSDIDNIYTVATFASNTNLPFISVYTKRQNDGNDAGTWYRSRFTYANYSFNPTVGTTYLTYFNEDPDLYNQYPRIELTYDSFSSVGPQMQNEEILTIAYSTSSNTPEGDYEFTAKNFGYIIGGQYDFILHAVDNANVIPVVTTANRPTSPLEGQTVIDSDLGYQITYFSGNWKNATGANV